MATILAVRPPDDSDEEGEAVRVWMRAVDTEFSMDKESLRAVMRRPGEVVRFEGRPPVAVCRLSVSRERERSEVTWLLPLNAPFEILQELLRDCLSVAGREFESALGWPVRGSFGFGLDAEMRARTWQQVFRGSTVRGREVPGDASLVRWTISLGTLRQAVTVSQRWRL